MPQEEYTISLEIPRRHYVGEVPERIVTLLQDYLAEDPCITENTVSFLVNCHPHEDIELEDYLVENNIPFDRESTNMTSSYGSQRSSKRYYRPGGCICGSDYDRTFYNVADDNFYVTIGELKDFLEQFSQEEDTADMARRLRVALTGLIVNNSPELITPIEEC